MLIADTVEENGALHLGQFGGQRGHSVADAAAMLVAAVEIAWENKRIAATLMMDVNGAFPTINHACLLTKMRDTNIDENLVVWMGSFMDEQRVEIVISGEAGDVIETNTGLPQGSPVSLVLFLVYIADLAVLVEDSVMDVVGLSFIDDVTWVVEGNDVADITSKLNRCAALYLTWAHDNAVRFEEDKMEAVLFSCQCNHHSSAAPTSITVGLHTVSFTKDCIQWLGYWLDLRLTFNHHHQKWLTHACQQ
jgi:hypothetical protein